MLANVHSNILLLQWASLPPADTVSIMHWRQIQEPGQDNFQLLTQVLSLYTQHFFIIIAAAQRLWRLITNLYINNRLPCLGELAGHPRKVLWNYPPSKCLRYLFLKLSRGPGQSPCFWVWVTAAPNLQQTPNSQTHNTPLTNYEWCIVIKVEGNVNIFCRSYNVVY